MAKPYDDKKHPRDTGKFTKIEGGLPSRPNDPGKSQKMPAVKGGAGAGGDEDPRMQQARDLIAKQFGQRVPGQPNPAEIRDPNVLRGLGFHAGVGYKRAAAAIDALHSSGDLQAMHHHGKILQDAVKSLKAGGAKSEEIDKLRRGLTGLHSALTRNDRVGAHEALGQLQHGFYHGHAAFQKEYGPGTYPLIGDKLKQAEAGLATKQADTNARADGDRKAAADRNYGKPEDQAHAPGAARPFTKSERRDGNFSNWERAMATVAMLDAERAVASQTVATPAVAKADERVVVNLHTAPVNHHPADSMTQFKDVLVEAMRAVAPSTITLPPTQVHVSPTPINVQPTPITMQAAEPAGITVINKVEPTPVTINNQIDVAPTPVTVENKLPDMTVSKLGGKPRTVEFVTDKDGKLTGAKLT